MKLLSMFVFLLVINFAFARPAGSTTASIEVNNLDALRLKWGTSVGDIAFVKGHTSPGDGGGGTFIWSNHSYLTTQTISAYVWGYDTPQSITSPFYSDNDGTIIEGHNTTSVSLISPANLVNTGRWVRQYDGYIDVRFFGAFGKSEAGATIRIKRAINFAFENGRVSDGPTKGTTVYFPNGSYIVNDIPVRNGVALVGDSMDKTTIVAAISGDADYVTPTDEPSQYLFRLDEGIVQTTVSNFNIVGRSTVRGCMYLVSRVGPPGGASGGLWNSTFKNIKISNFQGHGIYLKGGGTGAGTYELPCQFNMYENVGIQRITDSSRCLKMEGSCNQQTFTNCRFDGYKSCESCQRSLNENVQISNVDELIPGAYSFINCVFQDSDFGVKIKYGNAITFDTCWFESLGIAIQVNADGSSRPSQGINIVNNFFADAAGFGTKAAPATNIKAGRVIDINNSQASILNNMVKVGDPDNTVNDDDLFILASNSLGVNVQGNSFNGTKLSKTVGLLCVTSPVSYVLLCNNNKEILVSSSSGTVSAPIVIKEIRSDVLATESLTIVSNGGYIELQSVGYTANTLPTKNLYLSGRNNLVLGPGQVATFIKVDNQGGGAPPTYQLTSIVKATAP